VKPAGCKIFFHSPELDRYRYPPECPFDTSRAGQTWKLLRSMGLLSGQDRKVLSPRPLRRLEIEQFHTAAYLDVLQKADRGSLDLRGLRMGLGTADCPIFEGMYEYAALAAGATFAGATALLSGEASVAFNPSGGYHHAQPDRAAGFCYINDVVLGCMALAKQDMKVLFVDVDCHHADGVQNAFYRRRDVMTISLHESGRTLFPGTGFEDETGEGEGTGFNVNVPLPMGTHDEAYLMAFKQVVFPLAQAYDPDFLVLELGADALAGDPLTHLNLTNNAYADVISMLLRFERPILVTGGGGYHVQNTVRAWALAWTVLCGDSGVTDPSVGMGGVMLESMDWVGGLRDRVTVPPRNERAGIERTVQATIVKLQETLFPIHGLIPP